jgi:hypothetical protein
MIEIVLIGVGAAVVLLVLIALVSAALALLTLPFVLAHAAWDALRDRVRARWPNIPTWIL